MKGSDILLVDRLSSQLSLAQANHANGFLYISKTQSNVFLKISCYWLSGCTYTSHQLHSHKESVQWTNFKQFGVSAPCCSLLRGLLIQQGNTVPAKSIPSTRSSNATPGAGILLPDFLIHYSECKECRCTLQNSFQLALLPSGASHRPMGLIACPKWSFERQENYVKSSS